VLAYRFDNRFVLSLALSTLAGWFGVRVSAFHPLSYEPFRAAGIAYGVVIAGAGVRISTAGIKKHFLETYLHVAANVIFIALVSGVREQWFYFAGLIVLAGLSIYLGALFRRFAFVVYGTIYGYIGVSSEILHDVSNFNSVLVYFIVSGSIVILSLVMLSRRLRPEE
jgi:hypothetical protein